MAQTQLQRQLKEEISHIARRKDLPDEPEAQSIFRMIYSVDRQRDLKNDPATTPAVSLSRAKASLRTAGYPDFEPVYDRAFFGE